MKELLKDLGVESYGAYPSINKASIYYDSKKKFLKRDDYILKLMEKTINYQTSVINALLDYLNLEFKHDILVKRK